MLYNGEKFRQQIGVGFIRLEDGGVGGEKRG